MLKQLVSKTCARIAALSTESERDAMRAQIRRARPERLKRKGLPPNVIDVLEMGVATAALAHVKQSASLAQALVRILGSKKQLQEQVCVAGILSYFVQPNDLIPDTTPGGFGFIDDAILLRAGYEQMFRRPPEGEKQSNEEVIGFLASLIPPAVFEQLDQSVQGLQSLIQLVSMMDAYTLQLTLDQMIANPLALPVVTPSPPGFSARTSSLPQGHFSNGMYFEGDNVVVPGGPALIDGQLHLPS